MTILNTEVQAILTYAIIGFTLIYAGYQLYRTLRPREKPVNGCSSSCNCDSSRIRKELLKEQLKYEK